LHLPVGRDGRTCTGLAIIGWPLFRIGLAAVQYVTHQCRVVFVQESNPEKKPADRSEVARESVFP
jgi:hypothetical protein